MPKRSCPKLTCKPRALRVGPLSPNSGQMMHLLHEELEALYLADVKGLYHEACAEAMDVSRPTFAKLLKSARRKCALMFIQGHSLQIDPKPSKLRIILPSDDGKTLSDRFQSARYFVTMVWDGYEVGLESMVSNPIYKQLEASGIEPVSDGQAKGLGSGRLIPPLLQNASLVCALEIGDGMRRNIEGLGLDIQILPQSAQGELLVKIVESIE